MVISSGSFLISENYLKEEDCVTLLAGRLLALETDVRNVVMLYVDSDGENVLS